MNLKQWQKYLWTFVEQFRGALELQRLISLHWVEICSPNFFCPFTTFEKDENNSLEKVWSRDSNPIQRYVALLFNRSTP